MNHATHTTALALKSAGFHQPETKIGQYWYDDNGIATVALGQYNGGIALRSLEASDVDWQWVLHCPYYTFAPTAVELLESLPPKTLAGFNNGEWSVMPAGTEIVFTHRNLAEAAAIAWLALNKNNASVETCQTCHSKPATEMHTCPYATEINDCNNECNCCDGCRHECLRSI